MSVLGRVRVLVETTVSMLPLWRFIWKVPTELDVEQVQEYLFLLQNALKHLLKPTLSTVFMDLDSYLNPKGFRVPTFTFDKTRQKTPYSTQ
jgi:hypothetical protein